MIRVSECIGTLCPVLDNYESDNSVPESSGIRSVPDADKDRIFLVKEFQSAKVFNKIPSCMYSTFSTPKNLLHRCDCVIL